MSLRRMKNFLFLSLSYLALILVAVPFLWIIFEAALRGLPYILAKPIEFFTNIGRPPGIEGGGVGHAIQGSLYMLGAAILLGTPVGIFTGIYMAERRHTRLAKVARFVSDVIVEFPTILAGIIAYLTLASRITGVLGTGPAAMIASFALALIMIPITARSVEAALLTIPSEIREGAYALGLLDRQVLFRILLQAARAGVLTAVIIGLAKIAGESAPILVSNGVSNFWFSDWDEPAPSLPVLIYVYGLSPFQDWQTQAWAASLVLLFIVLGMGILARRVARGMWVRA